MNTHASLGRIAAIAGTTLGIAFAATLPARAFTQDARRPACTTPAAPAAIRGHMYADRPELAKALDLSGTTNVRIDLDANGDVANAAIVNSSGHEILDREALSETRAYRYVAETQECASVGGSYLVQVDFSAQ